jgi:SAM-dependent methyltransferase
MEREGRVSTFESNALAYDRFRPGYPPETFAELASGPDVTIIEVGCGTGQATVDLAGRAGRVLAIEPGPTLARLARERTADLGNVEIHHVPFERAPLEASAADAVFAGMSWHWVDADLGTARLVEVLRDDGLAVFAWHRPASEPVGHERIDDAFKQAIQRLAPHLTERPTPVEAIAGAIQPLEQSPELDYQGHRQIAWTRRLDADTARGLFSTYSTYAALTPGVRRELLQVLHEAITAEPGAAIDTAILTDVHTFRRLPRNARPLD